MSFDLAILVWIITCVANPVLDLLAPLLSALGEHGLVWIAIGAVMIASKKTRRYGVFMLAFFFLGWVFGEQVIKPLVMRPRPFVSNPWLLPLLVPDPGGYSFPSGHTLTAFCAATVIFFAPVRKPWKVLAYILATFIALSRLYLCVHYPTDVLGGMLIGIAFGVAGGMLAHRWRLDLVALFRSWPRRKERGELASLELPEALSFDAQLPLPEHPHPSFARKGVKVLNGTWDFCVQDTHEASSAWSGLRPPASYDEKILVPFSPETKASGIGRSVKPDELMWYRYSLDSEDFMPGAHYLLHFEAVDFACAVYCNGIKAGVHEGAYEPFSFDVTDALVEGENEFAVCVWDPNDADSQPRGRQSAKVGGVWHTAQSGIWQSVWLEGLPGNYIESAELFPSLDDERLSMRVSVAQTGQRLDISVSDADGKVVARQEATVTADRVSELSFDFFIAHPRVWSPDDPHLYTVRLVYGRDEVTSYCAFRTVEVACDEKGTSRLLLNHRPFFVRGTSVLGYWPETLMTAPSDAALLADIGLARALGFNTVRMHDKVESERWYYLCDKAGMLVWQDIVGGGGDASLWTCARKPLFEPPSLRRYDDASPAHYEKLAAKEENYRVAWRRELQATVERLKFHPSVITWSFFDEGRGQFDSAKACELVLSLDPTRPVDAASGWFDQGAGSYRSVHEFFRPPSVTGAREGDKRAFVLSAFGAGSAAVSGHVAPENTAGLDESALSSWGLRARELLASATALEEEGASGFIYCQLYDVEEELDGLVTYDRRYDKLAGAALSYPGRLSVETLDEFAEGVRRLFASTEDSDDNAGVEGAASGDEESTETAPSENGE